MVVFVRQANISFGDSHDSETLPFYRIASGRDHRTGILKGMRPPFSRQLGRYGVGELRKSISLAKVVSQQSFVVAIDVMTVTITRADQETRQPNQ